MKKIIALTCLASLFVLPCLPDCRTMYYESALIRADDDETMDVSSFLDEAGITYAATETENNSGSFPASFDLRDYNIIPDIKDQGDYGTCWAIAASDSIETQLRKGGDTTDLSEWHLAYFTYKGYKAFMSSAENVFNSGGTNSIATAALARWHGMTTEEKVPYDSGDDFESALQYESDYKVTEVYNVHPLMSSHIKHSVDFLKELIYNQNAVAGTYYSRPEFYNADTYSHYCSDSSLGIDHAVVIIGWDDNYPKENFLSGNQPSANGAWLAKNSWGDDWGDNGYFWISYEDKSLCEAGCYFVVSGDTYTTNYQYDEAGWDVSVSADSSQKQLSGYMSNVFTAQNNDPITAVAFYTTEDDAEYEISVYTNVKVSSLKPSPVNGTLVSSASGSQKYTGYHTVTLDTPVQVNQGDQFSVVVKLTNHTSPYTIPMEASSATTRNRFFQTRTYLFHNYASQETDPSYISPDGETWYLTTGKSYSYLYKDYLSLSSILTNLKSVVVGNVCLKAFSSPADSVQLPSDTPDPQTPSVTEPEPPVSTDIYDINSDGKINSTDYIIMMKMFFGDNSGNYSGDVNSDGKLSITDFVLLKERLTDTSAFPVN